MPKTPKVNIRYERVLRKNVLAPETLKQYIASFNHWRIFLHSAFGQGTDPLIMDGTDPVVEDRVIKYVGWQLVIKVRPSTLMSKLAAITYFHAMRRLGRPFSPMTRFHKKLRAYKRLSGEAVHKLRLSRELPWVPCGISASCRAS